MDKDNLFEQVSISTGALDNTPFPEVSPCRVPGEKKKSIIWTVSQATTLRVIGSLPEQCGKEQSLREKDILF